ncbi:MAG: radical SAM protein [Chloroflexi bacterium]|nr:radical SAM protein [Chloroflexota bacterium]
MFKRVLFCVPESPNIDKDPPQIPHIGFGYLMEVLDQHHIENDVIDMRLGYKFADVKKKLDSFKPDLVGVTMWTYYHELAYDLVKKLKAEGYTVVVGGPHVSTFGGGVLEECQADFAVKHEGEFTIMDLCTRSDWDKIEGIAYRRDGHVMENPDRPRIHDLDSLQFPRYARFELPRYARKMISIVTSRGCPYNCTFCPIKTVLGKLYVFRSAKSVAEEINYWYEHGYRELDIVDDNFAVRRERVYEICDLLKGKHFNSLKLVCCNGIRADLVDEDILKRMYEVGFREIAFGVESGNSQVLKTVKKAEDVARIERSIDAACKLGYEVTLFFIVGLPGETLESLEDSIKLAYKYPIARAKFMNLVPFPATELFDWAVKNNYLTKDPKEYLNHIAHHEFEPLLSTPEYTVEQRRKGLARAKKAMADIKKRSVARQLGNSPVSRLMASLIYSGPIHGFIFAVLNTSPPLRRLTNKVLNRLGLVFYE